MDEQPRPQPNTAEDRRPYRPPVGVPLRGEGRWGAPFSIGVHVLLVVLLLTPVVATAVAPELFPGGGLGPAGGGGGGTGGVGWRPEPITPERLRYMRIAPAPPASDIPETMVPPLVVPKEETPPPEPERAVDTPPQQTAPDSASVAGTGGTGTDGTSGTGPGSGGGTGSGSGTGTGSGNGPGTGGGAGRDYLPMPDVIVPPPEPRPNRVRGKTVVVTFTLNERGDILRIDFETTGDRGYDRRLRERMNEMRFRPAVGPDGQPMSATYPVTVQL